MDITCPTITQKVAGKDFALRMDFNALVLAEKTTGSNFLDPKIWQDMNVTDITALFWACSAQTDPKLTLSAVRSLGYKHATDITAACQKAWRAVNEIPEEETRPTSGS